jgi:hypothetical protein
MKVEILETRMLMGRDLATGPNRNVALNIPESLAELMWVYARLEDSAEAKPGKNSPIKRLYLPYEGILCPKRICGEKVDIRQARAELARYVRKHSVPVLPIILSKAKGEREIIQSTESLEAIIVDKFSDEERFYRSLVSIRYPMPIKLDSLWG